MCPSRFPVVWPWWLGAVLLLGVGCGPAAEVPAPAREAVPAQVPPATDGGVVLLPQADQAALLAEDSLWAEALRIHYNALVMDGHCDTPTLMLEQGYDLGTRHTRHHVDLPRMYEGGLDAPFFAVYVPARFGEGVAAKQYAERMIAEVRRQAAAHAAHVEVAETAADVRRITASGRKALLMGIEGGHALMADTANVAHFRRLGIRYITLTHVNTNAWADASQSRPRWDGLNAQGERMIAALNAAGVLVDLSHASDATFYDALRVSTAPVIASHSSARALVDNVRNLDDDMIRALATRGGVVMVNFYEPAVSRHLTPDVMAEVYRRLSTEHGGSLRMLWPVIEAVKRARGLSAGSVDDVVRHIDHIARLVGVEHVALGSDFDGVPQLPVGLHDVTRLPWITYGLLRLGYSEEDLYQMLGGNTLRVLEAADKQAKSR